MGQQQLLLIVLGVIIVGVAVVVGIGLFQEHQKLAALDTLTSECHSYAEMYYKYYLTPKQYGGGGHSWEGFNLPLPVSTLPVPTGMETEDLRESGSGSIFFTAISQVGGLIVGINLDNTDLSSTDNYCVVRVDILNDGTVYTYIAIDGREYVVPG